MCDMGISKLRKTMQTMTTASRSPKGTYPYMAPEMFTVEGHRGTAADVYSAGCLFIKLFGRRRVWPGLDAMQIMNKICGTFNCPPVMPNTSHLREPYRKLCTDCCQLDYTKRIKMDGVVQALQDILAGLHDS